MAFLMNPGAIAAGIALLVACPFAAPRAEIAVLGFDEVESGMRGTGLTVFEGTRVESFDVEILGKLPNIGPGQNLILARCSGGPLEQTGVLSGMSGSPIRIDGKLVGAVAYSWGFAKTAVAGITPINEMLAIMERDAEPAAARTGSTFVGPDDLARLSRPGRLADFFSTRFEALVRRSGGSLPTSIPLAVSGMPARGLERLSPDLTRAGFLPVLAGRYEGRADAPAPPLEPGSAVGLQLVRGDIEMTATGTVTWIDGDQVLAFGHPLFGLGAVDLPLTGATVQALLPSLQQSVRLATPLAQLGAFRQDRPRGVYGRLGVEPRMIPVRFQLSGSAGAGRTFSFDIADDPLMSPLLLYASLKGILASRETAFGSATARLETGSVIKMLASDDVELDNLFAGETAFDYGTGIAPYILYLLMNNTWSQPQIAGINLILDYDETPRVARLRQASLSRYQVCPRSPS